MGAWKALEAGSKNILISWARRHGKDVTTASMLSQRAIERAGSYYYYFLHVNGQNVLYGITL